MFINEFISLGMYSYFNNYKDNPFERHIIECICDIYGFDNVLNLCKNGEQNEFIKLLKIYGYPENYYVRFISLTLEYEEFKKEIVLNPEKKSNIYSKIEAELIKMIGFKWMQEKLTEQEFIKFENDLLNNFEVINLKYKNCTDPDETKNLWAKRKVEFKNNVGLETIKIDFLEEEIYKRFNLEFEDVQQMDYRMVNQLNRSIVKKMQEPEENEQKKQKFVLANTSGKINIFIILAIIMIILVIGVIAFIIIRGK